MSKHNTWKKTKTIYWSDEIHDDFDELGLKRPGVPKNYKYIRKNPINNFFSNILYFIIAVPILGIYCYLHGIHYEGRNNLRKIRKTGGYIYANHVAITDVLKYQVQLMPRKRINVIGYSDCLSVPILKHAVRALGYIPLPDKEDKENFARMIDSLNYYVNTKHQYVLIFPEAHIWPYYTKIRNFHGGSFYYPALHSAPILPLVTTWKKKRFSKKPKQIIRIGKPIFPIEGESVAYNKEYLYNECLNAMKELADIPQYEYIKYIKKEN